MEVLFHANGTMPYEQFGNDSISIQNVLPHSLVRLNRVLKALSQCQVLLGLVSAALASLYLLNDGVFGNLSIGIFIGFYYAITGFIGICGSSSFRRGLIISYMVMCVHAAVICVPATFIVNGFALDLDARGCSFVCRIEDLTCGLSCQGDPAWTGIPNIAARSIDIAQITLGVIEFFLALACAILCCIGTCERFGMLSELNSLQIMRFTRDGQDPPSSCIVEEYKISPTHLSHNSYSS